MKRGLDVVQTGPLAIVQDLGRPGHAALGVGVSGAADPASLRLAHRAVGNPPGAAATEVAFGGLRVRCRGGLFASVTGAPARLLVGGRPEACFSVFHVPDGAELRMGVPAAGLRSYLAVRAGRGELPSEGTVAGALQVPPSGQPVLFLADHPLTGGYPVIAVVASADIGRAAQARPGQRLRFRPHPAPNLGEDRP
ncbi:hypothetical protein [Actinomadura monticuli]|uniref:Biotin-dependent carboxyltransferase family protein n=1 Tax=Actinomadura monticuli TaxID=3097367 RepID=A0ABV4Q7J7_9ACTN